MYSGTQKTTGQAMNHHERPFYWAITSLILLVGLGYYVMDDVSHDIDAVIIGVQRVPKDESPLIVKLRTTPLSPRTQKPFSEERPLHLNEYRLDMVAFERVPQGYYDILIPSQKCSVEATNPGTKYANDVQGHFRTQFEIARTARWEKPYNVIVVIDLEHCTEKIEFSVRPTWKW